MIVDVDMSTSNAGETSIGNKRAKCNRKWTCVEDTKLVEALIVLVTQGGWRADNELLKVDT